MVLGAGAAMVVMFFGAVTPELPGEKVE